MCNVVVVSLFFFCFWCSLCHKEQFTLFLFFLIFQTIPATNRLSLPEVTKRTLRRTCRKQARSWPCCWSAYQHSSLYSASLCPGGHLHLAWPESAPRLQGKGGGGWSAFAWLGIRAGFSRNPLFFSEIYLSGLSPSVSKKEKKKSWCWKWERQFSPSQTFNWDAKSRFLTLSDSYFPVTFLWHPFASCLCHRSTDVYPHTHTHTHTHTLAYTCLESQIH